MRRTFNDLKCISKQSRKFVCFPLLPRVLAASGSPQKRERQNKGYCFSCSCHTVSNPFAFHSSQQASHCAKGRSRLPDGGRRQPLTWEINLLTGGLHGGEGLNQQHTFLLPVRLAVFMGLNYTVFQNLHPRPLLSCSRCP